MKLRDVGEFGLIDAIASRFTNTNVVTGIGDDAAVTAPSPGMQTVTSTDMLVEGVHFDLSFCSPFLLGKKALAVNLSDLAAMGARPRWFLLSLAIPSGFALEAVEEFCDGLAEQSAHFGLTLIGGDTCASRSGLVISITIIGEQRPELIVRRSGAVAGDDIWVTGTLGDSSLGLDLLMGRVTSPPSLHKQPHDSERHLIARHLDPTPRVDVGIALAEAKLAHSMIDVSDGLLADLGHICSMSGTGAALKLDQLPLSKNFYTCAGTMDEFPWHYPLAGGEDYELAFTASPGKDLEIQRLMKKCGTQAVNVGIVTAGYGVVAINRNGAPVLLESSGYTHFSQT